MRIFVIMFVLLGFKGLQAENLCKDADALGQKKQYAEALKLYKEVLAQHPNELDCLFNGGLTAYLGGDFKWALRMWQDYKKHDPQDRQIRSKLIQVYQALGQLKERDAERADLFTFYNSVKGKGFNPNFCRDQFDMDGRHVSAYEFFGLLGDFAQRYKFVVSMKGSEKAEYVISLGSYKKTNDYALQSSVIKPGERLFHLDGYYDNNNTHQSFQFYKIEPSYDQVKKEVISIIQGKTPATSSSQKSK